MKTTIAALMIAALPALAQAQSLGIKFDEIPVGTQFFYTAHGKLGVKKMEQYKGFRNGKHEIYSYFPKGGTYSNLYRITRYDAQGRVVEIEKVGMGSLVRFEPFHCDRSGQSKCTHTRTTINTKRGTKSSTPKQFEIRKSGKRLTIIRNADTNRLKSWITLGDHNIIEKNTDTAGSEKGGSKLVKIVRPQ